MKKDKAVLAACAFAFAANFILFAVKLYIGLRSNSISIFSDAVNNLSDSMSGVLTLACLSVIMKKSDTFLAGMVRKSEQLFSFLMSIVIALAGLYFAYTAIERFMYPTPVWFMSSYAFTLGLTAVAKIAMFFIYKAFAKRTDSPVVTVMKYDSILDFFITLMTVITLIVSQYGSFSFDALFGLIISIIIFVSAVKLVISSGKILVNYVSVDDREKLRDFLGSRQITPEEIVYTVDGSETIANVKAKITGEIDIAATEQQCLDETGVTLRFTI